MDEEGQKYKVAFCPDIYTENRDKQFNVILVVFIFCFFIVIIILISSHLNYPVVWLTVGAPL